jgi:hypothetical protein
MERILKQIKYTGTVIPDRDIILMEYAGYEGCDDTLVNTMLTDTAYEYFVDEAIVNPGIFELIYEKYLQGRLNDDVIKLSLLKFWSENIQEKSGVNDDVIRKFILEFMHKEIYFPFFVKFADIVPQLHYVRNYAFIEYRTQKHSQVHMHYAYDESEAVEETADSSDANKDYARYEIEEMREMYDGIYVSMFELFQGDTLQYYITEGCIDEDNQPREHVTESDTLHGKSGESQDENRFDMLNDILLSISLQDEATAQQIAEEYLYRDFCARELFRVL